MRKITKIEPTVPELPRRKRVAAYARVSMETNRLMHSLTAQISHYSELIQKNPAWEYAGVYADNFVSGTDIKKRDNFQRMLADCEKGLIDIILCKSISRFARNTVDLLETVRHLKELGIEVRFEKEKINSLSGDGELMLTILASFAQEESRSLSENVKWGIRKRFAQGAPCTKFNVYGYRWEEDQLVPIPEEAVVVRRIFRNFLDGKSRLETERELNAEGITTRKGCKWVDSNIKVILSNITYTGNLLLQKEFVDDPIYKSRKKNRGELPQYYVEGTHEAIIDMETFQYVQEEMRRRKALGPLANKALNTTCFTGKIKCPFCNVSYMHSIRRDRGFMEFWGCGTNKKKGSRCPVKGTINHKHMVETCVKVLGLAEFDEEIFLDNIDYIAVPARETLEFHMKDGRIITEECKNTGHQDCWTSEYRAKTSEKRRNNIPHNKKGVSCFTTRIKCMNCGSNYRRQKGQSQVIHWRCGNQCGAISLRLDLLEKMCADVLSLEEFNEDVFQEKIQHINVKDSTLIFVFKDGHSEEYIWEKPPKVGHKWTEEQREKYRISIAKSWTPERRAATSKQIKELRRREKLAKNNKNSGNAE